MSITYQVTIPLWLTIEPELRAFLVKQFALPRSAGTTIETKNGTTTVVCDGHTHADLAQLTAQKMQQFVGSAETDFWKLLEQTLAKVDAELHPPPAPAVPVPTVFCSVCESKRADKHKKNCPKFE